jgi:S-adenosylmethionine:tRNA ribosyltransferase-isomerase
MTIRRGLGQGEFEVEIGSDEPAAKILARIGRMPLPPYIHRGRGGDDRDDLDRQRYQTVYARAGESVAAPTAGLHFTDEMLSFLAAAGIERVFVTLHVGMGTFKPVTADALQDHVMHEETFEINPAAAERLNEAKRRNQRIVAVGTTAARVLESQPADEPFVAKMARTAIFIYPPYQWKHVNALVTNFHLPRSTLIALVAALTGLDEQRRIYAEAIAAKYRFFSYGDAKVIE